MSTGQRTLAGKQEAQPSCCKGAKFATWRCPHGRQIISSWKKLRPKTLRKKLWPSPYLPEECIQKTSSRKGAITRGTYSMNLGYKSRWTYQSLFAKIHFCVSLSPQGPANICLPNISFFHLNQCQLPSSLLKSQTTTPNILFCLSVKIVFQVRGFVILACYPVFLGIHAIKLCLIFSC